MLLGLLVLRMMVCGFGLPCSISAAMWFESKARVLWSYPGASGMAEGMIPCLCLTFALQCSPVLLA